MYIRFFELQMHILAAGFTSFGTIAFMGFSIPCEVYQFTTTKMKVDLR
ncbi:MAG: hypothetical protein JNM00_10730 [Flavobacteriales bacterium]|nr:hypothetical protein [Flavobacteriales bacterium]